MGSDNEVAGARLSIDLDAIVSNYRTIRQRVGPSRVAAVLKADAYGLGAVPVARALETAGCSTFFVAQLSEAAALRPRIAPGAELYILNGLQPGAEPACAELGATPVLNSIDQLDRWANAAKAAARPLPAALQVDSGMARLGLSGAEAGAVTADRVAGIDLKLVKSHLACADDGSAPSNAAQHAEFERWAARFPDVPRSLDNSGGAFAARVHFDVVRAGIALYGGAPRVDYPDAMRNVVSLVARIIQVRDIQAETGVGYGLSFVAATPRRIATIAVGYADGWPRRLGNRGNAFIGGIRVPIAGRVSMDSITLDVTEVPEELLLAGSPVELLGPHRSVDDVARDADTISYEILTHLGARYARTYLPTRDLTP